jgi:hypothetical protein
MPGSYFELVNCHALKSIHNEGELDASQAVLDGPLQRELDEGRVPYLDALSDLMML